MRVGVRVVRGPHWKWQDQDGGEGSVGTVVDLPATAARTCVVQWDARPLMNYRAGFVNRYDLRVFDSAPSGVKHNFQCIGCNDKVICGILWCCADCPPNSVFLCTFCYMSDCHSTAHSFKRVYDQNSTPLLVPPRRASRKLDSVGIFRGAAVRRGRDWAWDDQDCDGPGTVTQLQGWSEESSRSVVCVEWNNRSTNVYRLGHRGKTDLMATQPAKGWSYYVDHLPNFGEEFFESRFPIFTVGETVRVDPNIVRVKKLSEGHGQWHESMRNYIGATGTVHRITENDDVRIIFEDRHKWTYNPKAVTKVFQTGNKVMLSEDIETLREYHGDVLKVFSELRSCHGTISGSRPESSLCTVNFNNGVSHCVHANCLYAVDPTSGRQSNAFVTADDFAATPPSNIDVSGGPSSATSAVVGAASASSTSSAVVPPWAQFKPTTPSAFLAEKTPPSERDVAEFARAIDRGDVKIVRDLLALHPALVDSQFDGEFALIRAINFGRPEIVALFGEYKVSHEIHDNVGDSIFHVAIKRGHRQLLALFAQSHSHWQPLVNTPNSSRQTPLHMCVDLNLPDFVGDLLRMFPNIHTAAKDFEGNMPLHLAINQNKDDIVDLMVQSSKVDASLRNDDGQNALHMACIKGKMRVIQKVLHLKAELINKSNKRGFAPLHIATFHNQVEAVRLILNQHFIHNNARIMGNKEFCSYTAMHLAIVKSLPRVVEVLVHVGRVDISLTEDTQLNTPLHLAVDTLLKHGCDMTPQALFDLQQIASNGFSMDALLEKCPNCVPLAICCYLIANGSNVNAKNKRGLSPLEVLAADPRYKHLLSTLRTYEASRPKYANNRTITSANFVGASSSNTQPSFNATLASSMPTSASGSASYPFTPVAPVNNDVEGDICVCCPDRRANVRFEPCNHILFCTVCVVKLGASLHRCKICQVVIKAKIGPAGEIRAPSQNEHMMDTTQCAICMERPKNIAPRCGHALCSECAKSLPDCPMCRAPMVDLRPVYL